MIDERINFFFKGGSKQELNKFFLENKESFLTNKNSVLYHYYDIDLFTYFYFDGSYLYLFYSYFDSIYNNQEPFHIRYYIKNDHISNDDIMSTKESEFLFKNFNTIIKNSNQFRFKFLF